MQLLTIFFLFVISNIKIEIQEEKHFEVFEYNNKYFAKMIYIKSFGLRISAPEMMGKYILNQNTKFNKGDCKANQTLI